MSEENDDEASNVPSQKIREKRRSKLWIVAIVVMAVACFACIDIVAPPTEEAAALSSDQVNYIILSGVSGAAIGGTFGGPWGSCCRWSDHGDRLPGRSLSVWLGRKYGRSRSSSTLCRSRTSSIIRHPISWNWLKRERLTPIACS